MATDVKELMAKVGKIRILTNRLIDDQLAGDYHSTFKGQGVEFDEVRPYIAGDDVRTIDWNVTARTGVPYIKRYSEERELTILFMVDVSGSQSYGSRTRSKMELAAEVTALLALTAIRNQDKIGLVLFSDKIVKYIPPRKGRDSVMRLVREVLAAEDEAKGGTDIEGALKFLNGVQKRRAVVFLVSWLIALVEYIIAVPANRLGAASGLNVAQLKIIQEVVTVCVFVPFMILFMGEKWRWDYLWALLCMVGAVYFVNRARL